MKRIILFLLLSLSVFADSRITIVPYLGSGSYNSSLTDKDTLIGLYSIMKEDTHSVELSIESKNMNYADGSKLNQINLTGSYKTTLDKSINVNTLLHYISNNQESDGTLITLLEAENTYKKNLVLGVQVAYSFYNENTLAKNMLQIKPSIKFNYGRRDSKWGTIHPKISFYYIKPLSTNKTLESSYFSTELGFTHAKGSFISTASIWFGEQVYAVRDNGFTIYNLNELHNSGYRLSSRYSINKDLGVKLSYSNEDYKTFNLTTDTLGSEEESINRILLVADFSF